jgi:aminoglycoside 3-N-acetyltransferase
MTGERVPGGGPIGPDVSGRNPRDRVPADGAARPLGRDQLAAELQSLGLRRGQDLLIHSSLRRVGAIDGGAATLLGAIRDAVGPAATLVVPAQTAWNSLTSRAFRAATAGLDPDAYARYVAAMPGFDPVSTPSARMGAFAEYIRTRPEARRSSHPQSSFAALGARAAGAMAVHDLDCHLGERSPLRWLYDADAAIALIGVGYAVCTAFHLAEYRLPREPPVRGYHCFTDSGGAREKCQFTDIDLDDSDFELLGAALDSAAWLNAGSVPRHGQVGLAECWLVPVRTAVDFACTWMNTHRGG